MRSRRKNSNSTRTKSTNGRQPRRSRGMTLIEMMIAATVSLLLVLAMVTVFERVGGQIVDARAEIEMSSQLRSVTYQLERDLEGLTVSVRPWAEPALSPGYFELSEGGSSDLNPDHFQEANGSNTPFVSTDVDKVETSPNNILGDFDDVLAFTARSPDQPFRGRFFDPVTNRTRVIESMEAEIIWWASIVDTNRNGWLDVEDHYVICRRVLLIRPDLAQAIDEQKYIDMAASRVGANPNFLARSVTFFSENDISVRFDEGRIRPNTLADLTKRENRFLHVPVDQMGFPVNGTTTGSFPHLAMYYSNFPAANGSLSNNFRNVDGTYTLRLDGLVPLFVTYDRLALELASMEQDNSVKFGIEGNGKFVMMTNVAAFDLKVFDPTAPIQGTYESVGNSVESVATTIPGDPGYIFSDPPFPPLPVPPRPGTYSIGEGAYVDLGWASTVYDPNNPLRSVGLQNISSRNYPLLPHVYDTHSIHYEHDGIDQDNVNGIDQGTNGLDDPNNSGSKVDGVDDASERETSPSYPVPLHGIKVIIRVVEPGTRQVRQATVVSDFVPE
ncbi:MAG: type II secretory pathway pseudopilin PulG [Pirellulaceae bacterium]|jgi:type II secretory pathway pseudopilin PulG